MEEDLKLAPIVLFVYNRPEHTQRTIESLLKNEQAFQSDLYIYSDGPKNEADVQNVQQTRDYIRTIKGFNKIIINEKSLNIGLANSVIKGVSEIIDRFGRVIVVEDDLELSRNFLRFMNHCLEFYEKREEVFSISAYCAPIKIPEHYKQDTFCFNRINSWGWATWKNRWEKVDWELKDFDQFIFNPHQVKQFNQTGEDASVVLLWQQQGKIDSWAIRFNYACFKYKGVNIYPVLSKVNNRGADGSGRHVKKTKKFETKLDDACHPIALMEKIKPDEQLTENYRKYFKRKFYRNWHYYFEINCYRWFNKKNKLTSQ